jgi:transposase
MDLSFYHSEISAVAGSAGRDHAAPQLLIGLWLYAYSHGVSSARELARRCEFEPGFQWLCGLNVSMEISVPIIPDEPGRNRAHLARDGCL